MVKISQMPPDSTPTNLDSLVTVDNESGTNKKVALADAIAAIFANSTSLQLLTALAAATPIGQNLLMNGGMNIWQRTASFTPNDDTYIADRWNNLSEANASWTFARDTDVPATGGSHNSLKCSNVTLNNQCGIVQILEGQDSIPLLGKSVSLSFYAKTVGTEIANLRCALLSWTGTEDTVTSDVIATWAQNGTNPTWAASYTMENTPSNLALTASWQKFTIENVAIDTAGMKNLAVVIWVDDGTIAAGDDFWVTQVFLNVGAKALPFEARNFGEELDACQRFYRHSYTYGIVPGTADGYLERIGLCIADTATDAHGSNPISRKMRVNPTTTLYAFDGATGSGTSARVRDDTAGGLETVTAVAPASNLNMGIVGVTTNTTFVVGRAYGFNFTMDAEM